MDSLTVVSPVVAPHVSSIPANNQHSVGVNEDDVLACESMPVILPKMEAGTEEPIQIKSAKQLSPTISRSSPSPLSNEISGQTTGSSVGITNNGIRAFGASPIVDEMPNKGDAAAGAKFTSELNPQFDLNYSLGACSNLARSCTSNIGSSVNPSSVSTSGAWNATTGSVVPVVTSVTPSQVSKTQQQGPRSDIPQPPKKPLSPYMRFSKEIWQQVKTANPGMSVCEVGATIGRIWRELDDTNKQRFIAEFTNDKARYDTELQAYLRTNGLQASDIIKPRAKKTHKDPTATKRSKAQNQKSHDAQHDLSSGTNYQQPTAPAQCSTSDVQQVNFAGQELGNHEMSVALPSFSQVWRNPDATTQRDLLAQVVYDSQLHDERDVSEIETANQGISMFANQGHLSATSGQSTMCSNELKPQMPKGSATFQKNDAGNWWWSVENNKGYLGRNALPQTGNSALQLPSAGGSSFTEAVVKTEGCMPNKTSEALISNCNWHDGNGIMVCKSTAANNAWIGQQPVVTQGVQNTNEEKGAAVDAEKLFLRGALVEKTQEVVQLMRELEQAYGLIHQLKQQNDFFHRWYQEQRSAQE